MPIYQRLLIYFFLIGIVPVLCVSTFIIRKNEAVLLERSTKELNIIADLKKERIELFFDDMQDHVEIARDYYNVRKNLPVLADNIENRTNPAYVQAQGMLDDQLQAWLTIKPGVSDILLLGLDGKIVYSVNAEHREKELGRPLFQQGERAFNEGLKGAYIGNVYKNLKAYLGYDFGLLISAPIVDFEDKLAGVIAFEINMGEAFKSILNRTGMGTTGEILLVRDEGDHGLFVNPLRFDESAALVRRVIYGSSSAAPAQQALSGENGFGESLDYRGKIVIAAWRHITDLGWGLVVKIDKDEIMAPLVALREIVLWVVLLVLFLVVFIAVAVAQSLSRPIKDLRLGAGLIGNGNLDVKVATNHPDEIGELSRAFDAMRLQLKESYGALDFKVKEKTRALEKSLKEAEQTKQKILALMDDLGKTNYNLQESKKNLERSNSELEQFAYVASHDLQEPLRMIGSYTELLERRYNDLLDDKGKQYIHYAIDGARRMQQLINDLLSYSRVGTQGKEFVPINLDEVCAKALQNLEMAVRDSKADIVRDKLPAVLGDEIQLIQLFQNLIGNALKFHGEALPQVKVKVQERDQEWLFVVSDNGIGFDEKYKERIFIIFQRLHGRTSYEGTGIGLAVCKKIVERHGGRIWVDSKPGEGAAFSFTLPKIAVV